MEFRFTQTLNFNFKEIIYSAVDVYTVDLLYSVNLKESSTLKLILYVDVIYEEIFVMCLFPWEV